MFLTTRQIFQRLRSNLQKRHSSKGTLAPGTTKIHIVGGHEYDALKQIRLVQLPSITFPDPKTLASIYVKRNMIFGTRVHFSSEKGIMIALPLLKRALHEAGSEGDQPQGLASLYGLCHYVQQCILDPSISPTMLSLIQESEQSTEGKIILQAVQSIATNVPRESNMEVGWGTYTDARPGWTRLAKEYGSLSDTETTLIGEPQLFQKVGAVLVQIEYIGNEENPEYWKDAGGSMAKYFFL